ncbi:MAG: hypothetical protein HY695_11865 [Deltaproteobacteria bacterium]|nr:hypothetical protein [Deltaproteobacteria bacterium]
MSAEFEDKMVTASWSNLTPAVQPGTPVGGSCLSASLVSGHPRCLGFTLTIAIPKIAGIHVFLIRAGLVNPEPTEVARALRRAVMARVQNMLGDAVLPTFFTGHAQDGSPAQSERQPHLTFAFEPKSARLLVISPHVLNRREPSSEELGYLRALDEALTDFDDLRAGSSGRLILRAISVDADTDPLFAASRVWESVTRYVVTRHTKHVGAAEALSIDLRAECRRRGLPEPRVTAGEARGIPGIGLIGNACLTFEVAVKGPILLGRNRHLGGGLFSGISSLPGPLPARMLNEFAYCPRLAYLEWVQGEWADSADTVEGQFHHRRVDREAKGALRFVRGIWDDNELPATDRGGGVTAPAVGQKERMR